MSKRSKSVETLLQLTRGRSDTDRSLLFRHIAQLVMQPSAASGGRKARLLLDIYEALSDEVDIACRAELARDVARMSEPSLDICQRLAKDDISVAAPVLKKAPFDECDLLEIVEATSRAHHLIIAERGDLTQPVWQAIAERGEGAKARKLDSSRPPAKEAEDLVFAQEPLLDPHILEAIQDTLENQLVGQNRAGPNAQEAALSNSPLPTGPPPAAPVPTPVYAPGERRHKQAPIPIRMRRVGDADMFMPVNDMSPASKTKKSVGPAGGKDKDGDRAPVSVKKLPGENFYLDKSLAEREAKTYKGPQLINQNPAEGSWHWSVDRDGRITSLSPLAARIFGARRTALIGDHLWPMLEFENNEYGNDPQTLIRRHHPLRDLRIIIRQPDGTSTAWLLSGHARFEWDSGRFTGYDGSARPQHPDQRETAEDDQTARPGHRLAAHLSGDASTPIEDMLAGIQRLARAAKRTNNEAMLTDIRALLNDAFQLRDMIQDADRISRMFGRGDRTGAEDFDVFKVVNACLEDDAMRHDGVSGGITRFRINPASRHPLVNFSRAILQQTFSRMLELGRELSERGSILEIDVCDGPDGRLAIIVPLDLAGHDRIAEDFLMNPDDQMKLGELNNSRAGNKVMTARLGLSALQDIIGQLGGQLDTEVAPQSRNCGMILRIPYAN
jgi:PAS domain-containing protein